MSGREERGGEGGGPEREVERREGGPQCLNPALPSGEGEVNATGVGKNSDFGPFEGYISESVQDRR